MLTRIALLALLLAGAASAQTARPTRAAERDLFWKALLRRLAG